jgi:leucyl-tRNA synthetase
MDRAFDNELNRLAARTEDNYARMMWREGLQSGFYELQLLRDAYRDWCAKTATLLHAGLVTRFMEVRAAVTHQIQ